MISDLISVKEEDIQEPENVLIKEIAYGLNDWLNDKLEELVKRHPEMEGKLMAIAWTGMMNFAGLAMELILEMTPVEKKEEIVKCALGIFMRQIGGDVKVADVEAIGESNDRKH